MSAAPVRELLGLRVRSPIPLGAPVADAGAEVEISVEPAAPVPDELPAGDVVCELIDGDRRYYTGVRTSTGYVLRYHGTADFELSARCRSVRCVPIPVWTRRISVCCSQEGCSRACFCSRASACFTPARSRSGRPRSPVRLGAVVLPRRTRGATGLRVEHLDAADALLRLAEHPRIHGWRDEATMRAAFRHSAELVRRVPVYEAELPGDGAAPDELARELVDAVGLSWPA